MADTTFLIVRHGETDWNRERKFMGVSDIPLNDIGHGQAQKIGNHLKDHKVDVIVSSPMIRTQQTAKAIHMHHPKIELIVMEDLKERSFGDVEGLVYEDAHAKHPELIYGQSWNYPDFVPPNGESLKNVMLRAKNAKLSLLQQYKHKTIVVVSHGAYIKTFMAELLSIPPINLHKYEIGNASLSIIHDNEVNGARIEVINRMPQD